MLSGPDGIAIITHHADTAEGEMGDVESFNGLARRRVKAALQQKKLDLVDLNTSMTFGQARQETNVLWGLPLRAAGVPTPAPIDEVEWHERLQSHTKLIT